MREHGSGHLRDGLTRGEARVEAEVRAESRYEVGRFDAAIDHDVLLYVRPEDHHPRGARNSVAGAVMLKAVAAGIDVGVAAEIRQDEHGRFVRVFRILLDSLPELGAQAVGALDA